MPAPECARSGWEHLGSAAHYLKRMSEVVVSTTISQLSGGSLPPARTACSILVEWANAQDQWVRRIVGEVLASRQELPEEVIDEAYKAYRVEKGLDAGAIQSVAPLTVPDEAVDPVEPLSLIKLDEMSGVNALAEKQTITFNPKLTILFGENATGKTGYVRVLKSIANVRTAEPVLGNVRKVGTAAKSASISFKIGGGAEETLKWAGETGVSPFTRVSVFDTRAVAIHVDDDLNYSYTPRDLSLFRYVATAMNGVKDRLERDRIAQTRTGNP